MSFSQKQLSVSFTLASGQFQGGGNKSTSTGLRMSCQIQATAGPSQSVMNLSILGLPLSTMNQLSTMGSQYNQRYNNQIDVLAGDDFGQSLVFTGVIANAFVDGQNQPNVALRVLASPGVLASVKPTDPTSIKGSADVAGMLSKLAKAIGLKFENNNVNVKLTNPYYWGSAWSQALQIAQDANIDLVVESGIMVITPKGTPRKGDAVLISALLGTLIGYPAFIQNNIIVKTLFNPALKMLGTIEVQSSLTPANGQWVVRSLEHELDTTTPNGSWFTTIQANPKGTQ